MCRILIIVTTLATLLYLFAPVSEADGINSSSAPLVNGLIGDSEWNDEDRFDSDWEQGQIFFKLDSQFVYVCIEPSDTLHTGLDLYLDNLSGEIFMLHISSAHGQSFLIDSLWEEATWGQPEQWSSNLVEIVVENGQQVVKAPEAFEFQISRQLLPVDSCRMMLHLKRPEVWLPTGADTLSTNDWPTYYLNRPIGE